MRFNTDALKKFRRRSDAPPENERLSPMMAALKALYRRTTPENMTPEELERKRQSQKLLGQLTAPMQGLEWTEFDLHGMKASWTRLERPHSRRHAILYCHGGGYCSGNLGYAKMLSTKLCSTTGYDVLAFEYRLAPEHPYPAALLDGLRAWDYLMQLGYGARDVVIAGDSAGGNMALVLAFRLRAAGRMLPGSMVLMSPWTDLTGGGASMTERLHLDPMLTPAYVQSVAEDYVGGRRDLTSPDISPLFGDFTGFPPVLIQVGTNEILYSDSERLAHRMREAGVQCQLDVWQDMWHVFQMFPIKKARLAMENVGRFLLEQL